MKLDLFNNLEKNTKDNKNAKDFLPGFAKFLENSIANNNLEDNGRNQIPLLQKYEVINKVTTSSRDSMYIKRNEILNDYASKTKDKGDMYFIYSKSVGKTNTYNMCLCEEGKSNKIIEIEAKKLPKGVGVDSILRMKNGKYTLDKKATNDILKKSTNEFDKILRNQNIELKKYRVEGHTYEVVEKVGDRVCLNDITKNNSDCFEEIDFPNRYLNEIKEGQTYLYKNGNYMIV